MSLDELMGSLHTFEMNLDQNKKEKGKKEKGENCQFFHVLSDLNAEVIRKIHKKV